ncbi:16S rRNA (cytosine967-C5)-methyltransferase [Microcella alkaliphila]|uniref:16S rRNA (Cytosine967-C5)-methyltransferase n=1 Tax=Microcella alkaliphila TaxID=279828 RepID=A0A4Q7TVY8_9MICO|nr:transcription antitermination factor NusB [Microcella alkaliphila]RZT64168.1 16S rRNA (cytosine967-C5)-methyltransferase [Microcella alkaliphila]
MSPRPTASGRSARRVAFDVVHAVSTDDAYANLLLPGRLREARLSAADAGFATELTYGTLRRRGFYDAVIERATGRAVDRVDPPVLDVLRLGAHQLLTLGTPPHAAVDESVRLVRQVGSARAAGFVNAALRRVSERDRESWRDELSRGISDPDALLAIRHAHPEWVVRALRAALAAEGREDELDALLAADNAPPRVTLVALPGLADAPDDDRDERTAFSPLGIRAAAGDPAADAGVAAGTRRVQDEGSQLAALALSRVRPARAGERWLDLCAGPGGKAALLAAEARTAGATLTANETVPARAELVRRALAPVDPSLTVRVGDGRSIAHDAAESFDRVLVDAPCTGLGALRRRPEARWRKTVDDVAPLATLQTELLTAALDATAPGGVVAYVTCSPHLAETRDVVDAVLGARDDAVAIDTRAVLAGVTRTPLDLGDRGTAVQLWPHRHASDAMFIQLIERRR